MAPVTARRTPPPNAPAPGSVLATILGSAAGGAAPLVIDPAANGPERYVVLDAEHGVIETGTGSDGVRHRVLVVPETAPGHAPASGRRVEVVVDGWRFEIELESAARAALRQRAQRSREGSGHSGPVAVRAIIPGVVVSVAVAAGDHVVAGQQLLAVEAMKMQNELRAPRDGTVERVTAAPGRTIEVGDLLVVIA